MSFYVVVESSDVCSSSSTLKVSGRKGTISSAIARQSGCGSPHVPWVITLKEGQRVDVTIVDFLAKDKPDDQSQNCVPVG